MNMHRRKALIRFAAMAILATLVSYAALSAGVNSSQAAVSLLYFRGHHNGDNVLLEWATATEFDTAYFFLERAETENGPYMMLDEIGLVPSEAPPDGLSGAEYSRQDRDGVVTGQTYWYVLVEVENSQGAKSRTQPVRVALGDSQPTGTATRTATPRPTATSSQSSASPTATPISTLGAIATSSAPGSTTTSAGRTVGTRPTMTVNAGQTAQSVASAGDSISGGGDSISSGTGTTAQSLAQATPLATGYPAPPVGSTAAPGIATETTNGYPPPPPTPIIAATQPYPPPTGPRNQVNGSPAPNIGFGTRTAIERPGDSPQPASNSPQLGTLFLWLGFAAALIVFASAMAGAIYYYSKKRGGSD